MKTRFVSHRTKALLLASGAILLPSAAFAQDEGTLDSEDVAEEALEDAQTDENVIVVSGFR